MLKPNNRKKIKRPLESRFKVEDYLTASEEWKRTWLDRVKLLLNLPTLEDISELNPSKLDIDSVRRLFGLTSKLIRTGPWGDTIMQSVIYPGDALLSAREKNLLIIKTSWLCYSEYHFVSSVCMGIQNGITWAEVEKLIDGSTSLDLNSKEVVLLRAVDELCEDFCITDDTWEQLSKEYNDEQILGIIFGVGWTYIRSLFSKCLDIQLEEKNSGFGYLSETINKLEWFTQVYEYTKKATRIFRKNNPKKSTKPRVVPKEYSLWDEESKEAFNTTLNTTYKVSSLIDLSNANLSELDTPSLIQLYRMTSNLNKTSSNMVVLYQRSLPPPGDPKAKSILPLRDKELIIIRTGWLCRAEFEFVAHVSIGLERGVTWEEVDWIIEGPDSPKWNSNDATLLRAVDELHENLYISDETWKKLSHYYNEQQLMSIIIVASNYHFVAMGNNSIGIQIEEEVRGFGSLAEKLNQIDWIKQANQNTKKAKDLYRSKINEIDT